MKCVICKRTHDTEDLADIFGKRVCQRCLNCIATAEVGTLIYDYYVEILKNNTCIAKN